MSDDREYLTEEEATRLWQRAARLQAEAATRAEALGGGGELERTGESSAGARDPLAGGVLTFEIQSRGTSALGRGGFAADLQMASDLSTAHITLTSAPTADQSPPAPTPSSSEGDGH